MVEALQIEPRALESALRAAEPGKWEVRMGTLAETWEKQG